MDDFLFRVFTNLAGRIDGVMNLRLILQPLVASILAVRAGMRDAREGRAPFFWALVFDPEHRGYLLQQGWKDIAKVFAAAVSLDVVYQAIELQTVYPGEAIIVALLLAIVPYLLVRAPVTRLVRWKDRRL